MKLKPILSLGAVAMLTLSACSGSPLIKKTHQDTNGARISFLELDGAASGGGAVKEVDVVVAQTVLENIGSEIPSPDGCGFDGNIEFQKDKNPLISMDFDTKCKIIVYEDKGKTFVHKLGDNGVEILSSLRNWGN